MEVYEAIRRRVAVREFKPDPLPEPTVRKILLAARWAPSQRNRQPWRLVVVQDRETLRRIGALAPTGGFIADAPLAIAIAMDTERMVQFDAARAIENMILVAWAEGVGTCYVGRIERDAVKELLAIPAEMELVTVMPFGFPTDEALGRGKRRKPLDEIAFRERFGQPYR
ncbi:MAG: nitroreductase family protein [Dehalococcoidia bacterium]